MGVILLTGSLVTGAVPASAAGWSVSGFVYPSGDGAGSISYQAQLRYSLVFTDPRCVSQTIDYHPNGVVTTTIGASTYSSPPLSQWTANTIQQAATSCYDANRNLISGVTGTLTRTIVTWTLDYSCQPADVAIASTLTDPDAGLTKATGFVTYQGQAMGWVPDYSAQLPASCPPSVATPTIKLSATEGVPGSPLTVTGTGYSPGSTATMTFDSDNGVVSVTGPIVGSATVGADGTFTADIIVPNDAVAAQSQAHWVAVSSAGSSTRRAPFKVIPALSVSPTSAGVGSSFTLTGSHFAADELLTVAFGGNVAGTVTTAGDGTFSFTSTVPEWASPPGAPSYSTYLYVSGAQDGASVPFTALSLAQIMDAKAALWGLGTATSPLLGIVRNGCYRDYQYGAIVSEPCGTLYVSHGAIRSEWAALGFENGIMGYPWTDEVGGLVNGGVYQNYEGGAIVWSPATGAHESLGAIRGEWQATGFESGVLGYPTTEVVTGLINGGLYQNYQGGAIVSSPASGTHESIGPIRAEWQATGFEHGVLAYPTTEVVTGLLNGGSYQNYQGGAIVSAPASGTHESIGVIRGEWQATGFESGVLGYPTTEVVTGLINGGLYQNYQGGAIVSSPASGTHESIGAIRTEWQATGFEHGVLGYPTTEVVTGLVNGGSYQNYQGGAIINGTITIS